MKVVLGAKRGGVAAPGTGKKRAGGPWSALGACLVLGLLAMGCPTRDTSEQDAERARGNARHQAQELARQTVFWAQELTLLSPQSHRARHAREARMALESLPAPPLRPPPGVAQAKEVGDVGGADGGDDAGGGQAGPGTSVP